MHATPRPEITLALVAGHLEGVSVAGLVSSLSRRRVTGVLHIQQNAVHKKLYVQDGRIVFAASSDPNARLGEMLLRAGKISLDQLEQALSQLPSGKRLGGLLVHGGALTPDGLVEAVLEQVKSIVLDAMAWEEGEYTFQEGPLPTEELITLQMKTGELLLQGMRRVRSLSRIRRGVGPSSTVYELAVNSREAADGLSLSESEQLVLEQLAQGAESIENLCRKLYLSNFDVYQALWALKLLSVVQPSDRPVLLAPGRAGTLDQESFAELLMRLGRAAETGILAVTRGSVERTFHIDGGRCVFATSNNADDGLVAFLFRRGVISLADKEETARRLLSNKRVGTILRDLGALDDKDLRQMVREQLSEIVYDTFRWGDGTWAFVPGPLPTVEEITLDIALEPLLAQGARRASSWTRVIRGCGGIDNPLVLTPQYLDVLDKIGAGVEEWLVVNALKTPQTPRRICRLVDLSDFRTCQILWTLVLLGAVASQPEEELDESLAGLTTAVAPGPAEVAASERSSEATLLLTSEEVAAAIGAGASEELVQHDDGEAGSIVEMISEPAAAIVAGAWEEPQGAAPELAQHDDGEAGSIVEVISEPAAAGYEPPLSEPTPLACDAGHTMRLAREEVESALALEQTEPMPSAEIPEWEPPSDLDQVIARFNAMHRLVYRTVRAEVGAGAVNFVRSCCDQLRADWTEGAKLRPDGTWDARELRKAIVHHRIEDPQSAYRELIDREIDLLRAHLGEHRALELQQQLHDLGAAHVSG